jgi:uncharacterized protein YggU (UPF0235/DUF167 family)
MEKVEQLDLDDYKVWVMAPPAEGQANEATLEALSDYFDIPISSLHIKSGSKSSRKLIEIDE